MNAHLAEISAAVDRGAHAILVVDQAGWHTTAKRRLPENITILPLPPRAPELNPVENLWQFMRDNWLSNRVNPTTRSSPSAARLGTAFATSPGASCPSAAGTGLMHDHQRRLVLRDLCADSAGRCEFAVIPST
jgi:hypothetical protein